MKEIKVTNNYDLFKKLEGNRITSINRINKIKNSILSVGYITSPILVNEKMEIIDGQGRYEALKELNLPIEYIVQNGLTIKECIAMNVNQTNWELLDYIKSYADKGNMNYVRLRNLMNRYPMLVGTSNYAVALFEKTRMDTISLKKGDLVIDDKLYNEAVEKLDYVYPILEEFKNISKINLIIKGLLYCLHIEEIDYEMLKRKIVKALRTEELPPMASMEETMQYLEKIYNRQKTGLSVFIYTEYRKRLEQRLIRGISYVNKDNKRLVEEVDEEK